MSVTVNVTQLKEIVKFLVSVKEQVSVPVYIHGSHGIGKTSIIRQVGDEIDYHVVVLNLANQTPEDLLGFPDGKGGYVVPGWLDASGKPTIYFLDEINRAPKYVLQCMFNFINEGRIHQTSIDPRDVVIAAGNPSDVNYETTEFEDKAFISRFAHFRLVPTQLEYIRYLEGCRNSDDLPAIHPALIKTIRTSADSLDRGAEPVRDVHVEPDNRALEKIGRLMNLLDQSRVVDLGYLLFAGMVGPDFASVIVENWKTTSELMSPESILDMEKDGKFTFAQDQLDAIVAINGNMAAYIERNIFDKGTMTFKMTEPQRRNLGKFLNYIPRDSQVSFAAECKNRMGEIVVDLLESIDPEYVNRLLDIKKRPK